MTASLWLDIVLPRTDAGVLAQLVGLAVVVLVASLAARHERALLLLIWGIGLVLLSGMGVRALHRPFRRHPRPTGVLHMSLDLAIDPSSPLTLLAYHGTGGSSGEGGSSLSLLLIVLGLAATAGWLIFSELRWRNTVLTAVGGWIVGLVLLFAL